MYTKLRACVIVRTDGGLTDLFENIIGTRQGCMLSPFLFNMYLDEFCEYLKKENMGGIYLNENVPEVNVLMYADDLVICADTVIKLQRQINILHRYCLDWGMTVNLSKTKVVVFRRGGVLRNHEKWFLGDEKIVVTSNYKYLGVSFTPKLIWTDAAKTLSTQANKALRLLSIKKFQNRCGNLAPSIALNIFDKMVVPILNYGAEVWGFKEYECIESVQIRFCKKLLGVGRCSSNSAILGELGRYPLFVNLSLKCIKYWFKLLRMPPSRNPRAVYDMLLNLDEAGRITWVTFIKLLLRRYGFGVVWLEQGVGYEEEFLCIFEQRLKDCCMQEWQSDVLKNSKLCTYSLFKTHFCLESYVSLDLPRCFIRSFTKLRCSNHTLMIEVGRHMAVDRMYRICSYCISLNERFVEDEYHFVCICKKYELLRSRFLPIWYWEYPNIDKFILLMNTKQKALLVNLVKYVYNAFRVRDL